MSSFLNSFALFPAFTSGEIPIEQPIANPRTGVMLPQGDINIGGIHETVHGDVPADSIHAPDTTTDSAFKQAYDKILALSQSIAHSVVTGSGTDTGSDSGPLSWILSQRTVSAAIGLLCIAGGLFMFHGTREVVINTAKTAAKVAATAA